MPTYNTVNTDFTGGLMDPHMRGRLDIEKFNKGLQRCENFLPSIQGPLRYREGTQWIANCQTKAGNVRLIDFSINNDNRYLIALSEGRINIYDRTGVLLYERTVEDGVPYRDADIYDIRYSREVERMIFTHGKYPPYELAANTVFGSVSLFANDAYIVSGAGTVGVDGEYSKAADVNSAPAYTMATGGYRIEYTGTVAAGGTDKYQLLTSDGLTVLYDTFVGGVGDDPPTIIPLTGWSVVDGAAEEPTLAYSPALQSTEPEPDEQGNPVHYNLAAGSEGANGLTPWTFSKVAFTSHPFNKVDTTDTVLSIKDETEAVRLISDKDDFTALVGHDSTSSDKYVEYKAGNQWGLGRVITSHENPALPDPTDDTVYVDPEEKVVNINDPSTRVGIIINPTPADAVDPDENWQSRDGVTFGAAHVRADALTFKTADLGAWVRVGGDKLFTNVPQADRVEDQPYNGQDGKIRWAKVVDYIGIEDHPVDFFCAPGSFLDSRYSSGSIYEIYDWGADTSNLTVHNFKGTASENRTAEIRKASSTWRFAMDTYVQTDQSATETTVVANMSTQRQFDVVDVDYDNIRTEGVDLIVPSGNVAVYDLVTDTSGVAFHTATLSASKDKFSVARDVGRFIYGRLLTNWVLMQIVSVEKDTECIVSVFNSIPRDELTGEFVNNGSFTAFRMGSWYTDNWPWAVSFYEQRRIYAGASTTPNLVWLSNLDDPTDFRTNEYDGKVLDTTGITYPLGTSSTIVRWLESGPTLIIGTESNEWQLRPNEFSAAITPSNIRITQETPVGSVIQGQRAGGSVFFPHISGRTLMEFKYDFQSQQFVVTTVTKLVPTLFENDPIKQVAYQRNPNATFWIVTQGGQLFTLTYRKEDNYYAWSKQGISGSVTDVAVLTKGDIDTSEDQVWFVVSRGGIQHLELLSPVFRDDSSDGCRCNLSFLDSHSRSPRKGSYESPATTVSVPARLVSGGKARIVADGIDLGSFDVSENGGVVTLPSAAQNYTLVGLPYTGVVHQNPYAFEAGGGYSYGQIKRIVAMRPYVYKSLTYQVGVSEGTLQVATTPNGDPDVQETSLYTGFMEEHGVINAQFGVDESPLIKHDQPYPLTLISNVQKVEVN